jgi:putative chitinase
MTPVELLAIMPSAGHRAYTYAGPLTDAMAEFGIDTPARQAMFLSQVGEESGSLLYTEEIASGEAYEGRFDLGNTEPGDGVRFKGRGLIETTGRKNYLRCGVALGLDLIAHPELLEEPVNAARSAGFFCQDNDLNHWADIGDFDGYCDVVNLGHKTRTVGDSRGYSVRLAFWQRACTFLKVNMAGAVEGDQSPVVGAPAANSGEKND